MRKFYLQNDIGERIDLQSNDHIFHTPTGLGTSIYAEYETPQDGFFFEMLKKTSQINIFGTIAFINDPEIGYKELSDWIHKSNQLIFVYNPYGNEEFFLDVSLDYMEKTERSSGFLSVPISFWGRSPWYKPYQQQITITGDPVTGYRYPFIYPVMYTRQSIDGSVQITINGHYDAAFLIEMGGLVTNPEVQLVNVNTGEIIGDMIANGVTISENETLIFDTRPSSPGVYKKDTNGNETDLTDTLDLSNTNYFYIPKNALCEMTIKSDTTSPSGKITVFEYYKSV